jgi:hypothetical protein
MARTVRDLPGRLEKQLSVRATELSTEALAAVVERLQSFRKELAAAIAQLPAQVDSALEPKLQAVVRDGTPAKRLETLLNQLTRDCRAALEAEGQRATAGFEKKFQAAEAGFARTLEKLAAEYEQKRLELIRGFESKSVTPILADTFKGNWKPDTLYRRGETFSFRGGWHLVLQDARGQLPGMATLKGPAPVYALLAAPGAPGTPGQNGTGGGGGDSQYVNPPLLSAGSTRGQWTFTNGYMYWAVANGTVIKWAVIPAP